MKTMFFILMTGLLAITACSKNNASPETRLNETVPSDSSGNNTAKYAGDFMNGPNGSVTGSAKVYLQNGKYVLALEGVVISNGPDLHVYISKEVLPVNFIDLGKLKSTNGNQLYNIPGEPDFASYRYALIHCQQYNHLFGSAELK